MAMKPLLHRLAAALALLVWAAAARGQEVVHFSSLADNGEGAAPTVLDAYLFRPAAEGRRPALVFLHGCGGLISRVTRKILVRELAWADEFNKRGWVVLMVDSFTPRGRTQMCAPATYEPEVARKRPADAYAALAWLQAQPLVRGDRIGLVGWSQGGGAVLATVAAGEPARPAALPQGDFRAAVAFYPGACRAIAQRPGWSAAIPLLVLMGELDVWTPLAPCRDFLATDAAASGAPLALQTYPGAYHDFDWPDLPRRELPQYRTASGVVPIVATDAAARADALARVPAFLARYLEAP
jgi:dienelactone hydrolase